MTRTSASNDYPLQEAPIYEFRIEHRRLKRTRHDRYAVTTSNAGLQNEKKHYRIWSRNRSVLKNQNQLDKYLNNHYWSFDPDPIKALGAIQDKLNKDAKWLRLQQENLRRTQEDLNMAKMKFLENDMEIIDDEAVYAPKNERTDKKRT